MDWLTIEIDALARRALLRIPIVLDAESATRARIRDRDVVVFCSNDYLGLRTDARLAAAMAAGAAESATGAGASRLVSGTCAAHEATERALAAFVDQPAALLMSSGYAANIGAIPALTGAEDVIFSDAENHASIIDGCRLSRARVVIVAHCDPAALAAEVRRARPFRRGWIVTETLFSMSGDVAPLREIASLCEQESLHLYVDEAHAIGTYGARGRGVAVKVGVRPEVTVGTLGKALGVAGAFVAGSQALREYLWNRARSFVFSTATAPPLAHAARTAVGIVKDEPQRVDRLAANGAALRSTLRRLGVAAGGIDGTPIIPIVVGDDARAARLSEALLDRGFFAQAIRPPTVSIGTARLRVTVSSEHARSEIAAFAAAVGDVYNR